jgi:hypothetical protein
VTYDYLDGIRIRALAGVMDPDEEAVLREIHRWYSEKFVTPLDRVPDLPQEHVLLNWFEVQYAELDEDEQLHLAQYLLETPEERKARSEKEKSNDEAFYKKSLEMNAKKSKKQEALRAAFQKQLVKAKAQEKAVEGPPPEEVVKYVSTGDLDAELDAPNGPLPGTNKRK